MRSTSTKRSRRSTIAPRCSAGGFLSAVLLAEAVLRADGGLRCGRGGVASCACICCGFVVFGAEGTTGGLTCSACFGAGWAVLGAGAEEVACSVSFGCGLAAGGGELAPASAAGVVVGAGIVMVGFLVVEVCFDDVDCVVAGASRRTGESGPPPGAGAASTVASGSAARASGGGGSLRAEKTRSRLAE